MDEMILERQVVDLPHPQEDDLLQTARRMVEQFGTDRAFAMTVRGTRLREAVERAANAQ